MCTKMFEAFPTTVYTILLCLSINLFNLTPAESDTINGVKVYTGRYWPIPPPPVPGTQCEQISGEKGRTKVECLSKCIEYPFDICNAVTYDLVGEEHCVWFNCPTPIPMPIGINSNVTGYAFGEGPTFNICPGKMWPKKMCPVIEIIPNVLSKYICPIMCQFNPACNAVFYNDNTKTCNLQECFPNVPPHVNVDCPHCTGFTTEEVTGCGKPKKTFDGMTLDIKQNLDPKDLN